jgi:hypothetical protein
LGGGGRSITVLKPAQVRIVVRLHLKKGVRLNGPKYIIFTADIHQDTPSNIHFRIKNEGQDCKISHVRWRCKVGEG